MPSRQLWSPWREGYVTQPRSRVCVFCSKPRSRQDQKNYLLRRSRRTFAMLNLYPYNNGHVLIAPYRHIGDLTRLEEGELHELTSECQKVVRVLKRTFHPDGYNIGLNMGTLAGASFGGHLHLHVVPRWKEDTNFMPITANTKVISQSLARVYLLIQKNGYK